MQVFQPSGPRGDRRVKSAIGELSITDIDIDAGVRTAMPVTQMAWADAHGSGMFSSRKGTVTILARYKARLKEQGDLFLDDLNVVRIEP